MKKSQHAHRPAAAAAALANWSGERDHEGGNYARRAPGSDAPLERDEESHHMVTRQNIRITVCVCGSLHALLSKTGPCCQPELWLCVRHNWPRPVFSFFHSHTGPAAHVKCKNTHGPCTHTTAATSPCPIDVFPWWHFIGKRRRWGRCVCWLCAQPPILSGDEAVRGIWPLVALLFVYFASIFPPLSVKPRQIFSFPCHLGLFIFQIIHSILICGFPRLYRDWGIIYCSVSGHLIASYSTGSPYKFYFQFPDYLKYANT